MNFLQKIKIKFCKNFLPLSLVNINFGIDI